MRIFLVLGIVGGVLCVLDTWVNYLIDPVKLIASTNLFTIGDFLLLLVLPIVSMVIWKRMTGKQATYGLTVKYLAIYLVVMSTIDVIHYTWFFYTKSLPLSKSYETEIKAVLKDNLIKKKLSLSRILGATKKQLDREREKILLDDTIDEKVQKEFDEIRLFHSDSGFDNKLLLAFPVIFLFILLWAMLLAVFLRSRSPRDIAEPEVP